MRAVFSVAMATLCFGLAAARYPTSVEVMPSAEPASFTPSDGRPADQGKSRFESHMITNCAYGSIRVGAIDITPEPLVLVRDGLAARANAKLAGRQVVLRNFTVHMNRAQGLRGHVGAMYSGAIPGVLNKQEIVGCAADDLRGGYVLGEVESDPVVAVIDVSIDGVDHHARCLATAPVAYLPTKYDEPEMRGQWNAAVSTQVACALDKLAAQINARTPAALPAP